MEPLNDTVFGGIVHVVLDITDADARNRLSSSLAQH
jgi:hypothetical protein